MVELKNERLTVHIEEHGAELRSVKDSVTNIEYMWQANPEYWARTAPVLFPFVGKLTDDIYYVDGTEYRVGQHGFARDLSFEVLEHTDTVARFVLKDNDETWKKYPFHFELVLSYELNDMDLKVGWQVTNPDADTVLPFSIGGHPAFNLKMFDADAVEDFYLEFDKEIDMQAWKLENGCFGTEFKPVGVSDSLKIDADIFVDDALVFKDIDIKTIALKNVRNNHGLTMDLTNFKHGETPVYLGIWSPYKDGGIAPFVCIEPWFGHADTVGGPFDIYQKPAIIQLKADAIFTVEYALKFY